MLQKKKLTKDQIRGGKLHSNNYIEVIDNTYQQDQRAHSTLQQISGMEWMQKELQTFL